MTAQPSENEDNLHRLKVPDQRPEESLLYAALRARQDQMHHLDNFTISVQPWVFLSDGRKFRPDFVVIMRSAWAVEIDGDSHYRRYAADRSRDELLADHSLPVLRIPVQDVEVADLVEDWVDRIIARCRGFRWNGAA